MRLPRVGVDATPVHRAVRSTVVKLLLPSLLTTTLLPRMAAEPSAVTPAAKVVDVSPDVAPVAGPWPAAAKSGTGGMVGKKRTLESLLWRSLTETAPPEIAD